jgi:hypothetical protein
VVIAVISRSAGGEEVLEAGIGGVVGRLEAAPRM